MTEFTSSEDLLSLHFGRTFWLDDEGNFCSAPTYKSGETDWERWDYVSEWVDLEGVDLDKLLDIHKTLVIRNYIENTEKLNFRYQVYQGA